MIPTFVSPFYIHSSFADFQCFYTSLLILLQFSVRYATNEINPSDIPTVLADPKQVSDRIYGSKIVVGSNQAYLLTLWGVKACLLTL
jgi:hypothetical protein